MEKSPPLLLRVARLPRTMSSPVAPATLAHDSSVSLPEVPTDSDGEPEGSAGGGSQVQAVFILKGLDPTEATVSQPMFSAHARPTMSPVATSMLTPAVDGEKLIQPTFSDQANPDSTPPPSFLTP